MKKFFEYIKNCNNLDIFVIVGMVICYVTMFVCIISGCHEIAIGVMFLSGICLVVAHRKRIEKITKEFNEIISIIKG